MMLDVKVNPSTLRNLGRQLRVLRHAEQGAATLELALVAPVFGVLLLGVVDLAQAAALRFTLEQAANRAVELATVRHPLNDSDDAYIKQEATNAVTEINSDADLNLRVQTDLYMTCDGVHEDNYASTSCGGVKARFAAVEVRANYSPLFEFGPLASAFGGDGRDLVARSEVRLQ